MSRRVFKCDKVTMRVVKEYPSSRAAAEGEGTERMHMCRVCKQRRVSPGAYVYRYADDYDPNERFTGKYYRPVIRENIDTGECAAFASASAAADATFVVMNTVHCAINDGNIVDGQYRFRYAR